MKDEVKVKQISPTFSVRIDIADTERKLAFIGEGDKQTAELFFRTLKRLSERMDNSESFTGTLYEMELEKDKEITMHISKEKLEELLCAILLL